MDENLQFFPEHFRPFRRLLEDRSSADLWINVRTSNGPHQFQVHRHILRLCTPFFEDPNMHNGRQQEPGIYNIEDCDSDAVYHFLQYAYCSDYSARDSWLRGTPRAAEVKITELHVETYCLAKTLAANQLAYLAAKKIQKCLNLGCISNDRFPAMVDWVYMRTTEPDLLRDVVISHALENSMALRACPRFIDVLHKWSAFATALFLAQGNPGPKTLELRREAVIFRHCPTCRCCELVLPQYTSLPLDKAVTSNTTDSDSKLQSVRDSSCSSADTPPRSNISKKQCRGTTLSSSASNDGVVSAGKYCGKDNHNVTSREFVPLVSRTAPCATGNQTTSSEKEGIRALDDEVDGVEPSDGDANASNSGAEDSDLAG